MERREEEILDRITMVRQANNHCWMKLLAIALEHAPEETKATLKSINQNDSEISDLLKDLARW